LALSPDGRSLYVSDTARGLVRVFADGRASPGEEFARVPHGVPDGLAVDEAGAVWVALGAGGIARFHEDGRLDGIAALPSNFVSSLCFGGPDRRDVYITTADSAARPDTGGSVFRARSEVAGLEVGQAVV
jgi:sugar lactone lactonase YvrE